MKNFINTLLAINHHCKKNLTNIIREKYLLYMASAFFLFYEGSINFYTYYQENKELVYLSGLSPEWSYEFAQRIAKEHIKEIKTNYLKENLLDGRLGRIIADRQFLNTHRNPRNLF